MFTELRMCDYCDKKVASFWDNLKEGQYFLTPDIMSPAEFFIDSVSESEISIKPQKIEISKIAFSAVIHYLKEHEHYEGRPCEIRSSSGPKRSGPLCNATKRVNKYHRRCVNYILPILKKYSIVEINGRRPNTTWLVIR